MMRVEEVIADLQERLRRDPQALSPARGDIERWTQGSLENEFNLYNDIGVELALGYNEGRYSFEFCDEVVNGFYALLIESVHRRPSLSWPDTFDEVYLAFDAGEFHRHEDKSDDPIAEHTDPLIAAFIAKL